MKWFITSLVLLMLAAAIAVAFFVLRDSSASVAVSSESVIKGLPGTQTVTMDFDGIEREFIVHMPEGIAEDDRVPVVFMFHGGNGRAVGQAQDSGWIERADRDGFIVVFPQSLKYRVISKDGKEHITQWGNFRLESELDPAFPNQVAADDVGFVRAIADYLTSAYPVDAGRFYANGFSNGGGFVNRLLVEADDLFAAFATNSSGGFTMDSLAEAGYEEVSDFVARPTLRMMGTVDPPLTSFIGVAEFSSDESAAQAGDPVRENFIDGYLQILGLSDAYTYEKEGRMAHFEFSDPLPDSASAAVYELYLVEGMAHRYPNGKNAPFMAVDIIWPFFDRYAQ